MTTEIHGLASSWFVFALGFPFAAILPAVLGGLSSLFGSKSKQKAAESVVTPEEVRCQSENQRRAALGRAVGQAYGLDLSSQTMVDLVAPRPCPKGAKGAGEGYGFVSDLLGGGSMIAGSLLNKDQSQGQGQGSPMGIPGLGGVPCPPSQIKHPVTGECVSPTDLFPEEQQ